jgi:hypothetical protein
MAGQHTHTHTIHIYTYTHTHTHTHIHTHTTGSSRLQGKLSKFFSVLAHKWLEAHTHTIHIHTHTQYTSHIHSHTDHKESYLIFFTVLAHKWLEAQSHTHTIHTHNTHTHTYKHTHTHTTDSSGLQRKLSDIFHSFGTQMGRGAVAWRSHPQSNATGRRHGQTHVDICIFDPFGCVYVCIS